MTSVLLLGVVYIGVFAILIGIGYGLTLLLPLTLFEASFLMIAVGMGLFYAIMKVSEHGNVREEKTEEAWSSWPPTLRIHEESKLPTEVYTPPQTLTLEEVLNYLLARDLWLYASHAPALAQYNDREKGQIVSALAHALVRLLQTNTDVFHTCRVSRKDLRPLLMAASLPQGTLAQLGELTEYANYVLESEADLVRLIATGQEWPILKQKGVT